MTFFSNPYTNPNKSASIPFIPTGVWRGIVTGTYDGPTVDVSVPRITGEFVYNNVEALVPSNGQGYSVGDIVYVSFIEGRSDDLLVLGPVFFKPVESGYGDSILFSWPGTPLSLNLSGRAPMPRYLDVVEIRWTFGTPGDSGSDTVIYVYVNNAFNQTVTISGGTTQLTTGWTESLVKDDTISFEVVSAGTNAADLVAQVRYI